MTKKLFILILIFGYSISLFSQKYDQKIFTLSDCIQIAMQENSDILISKANIIAANSSIKSAFGNYLPQAQFTMSYSRQLNATGGKTVNVGGQLIPIGETPPNSYNMGINLGLNLFDGFAREANFQSASELYDKSQLSLEHTKSLVKLNIYRLFFDYASKKKILDTRRDNLERGKKELESIRAKNQVGQLPINIVYSKEAEIGGLELELARAENDLNLARANLLALIGLNPNEKVDFYVDDPAFNIKESEFSRFKNYIGFFEDAVQKALANRTDYKAIEKEVNSRNYQVKAAQANYFPKLQLGGGWSWSNSQFSEFADKGRSYIGLNLSLPIFDGFQTNTQIQYAEFNYKSQQIQLKALEKNIRKEVEQAFLNLDAAEKQITISEKSLIAAEMNYKVLQERFNVGTASITDLIQANSQYLSAQINKINSYYYYLLSQKEIEYAIGLLN